MRTDPVKRDPAGFPLVLLQRRINENHIKLCPQGGKVKGLQVTLEVHGLCCTSRNLLILQGEEKNAYTYIRPLHLQYPSTHKNTRLSSKIFFKALEKLNLWKGMLRIFYSASVMSLLLDSCYCEHVSCGTR